MSEHYSFNVLWSELDECYLALCPEFPGLSALGATPSEAIEEGMVALELFLEEIRESGQEPPSPRTLVDFSGQFRVRLPRWLHAGLVSQAGAESVSLNSLIISYLAASLGRREKSVTSGTASQVTSRRHTSTSE